MPSVRSMATAHAVVAEVLLDLARVRALMFSSWSSAASRLTRIAE